MTANVGSVAQIFGPVVDVRFDPGQLPAIFNAIAIKDPERDIDVVVEVAQHLGNDVARSLDSDRVSDSDIQSFQLIGVVQGGARYGHSPYSNGGEPSHGGHSASSTHLIVDVLQSSGHAGWRELVGDGPARCAGDKSEGLLKGDVVDFDHCSIDLEGECVADIA